MAHVGGAQTRWTQLDGLRGIAALCVVICHTTAVSPRLGSIFSDHDAKLGTVDRLLAFTPMHFFWNGAAAVLVFFVLSGFVLLLPFTPGGRPSTWLSYYPRRLLRLYLPVCGAVILTVILIAVVPRITFPGQSSWANAHDVQPSAISTVRDATLFFGNSGTNSALWSLEWEVVFSVLLPLYVLFAVRMRRAWPLKLLLLLALTGAGQMLHIDALTYLPVFGLGATLAVERESIREWTSRLPTFAWIVALIVGLLLFDAEWNTHYQLPFFKAVIALGSLMLVIIVMFWRPASSLANTRPVQWLGRISFSLYLIHLPIVLATVALFSLISVPLGQVVGFVAAFVVATLFYRFVERPAHRLSQLVGRALTRRTREPAEL